MLISELRGLRGFRDEKIRYRLFNTIPSGNGNTGGFSYRGEEWGMIIIPSMDVGKPWGNSSNQTLSIFETWSKRTLRQFKSS
jgi:hypothetical protein